MRRPDRQIERRAARTTTRHRPAMPGLALGEGTVIPRDTRARSIIIEDPTKFDRILYPILGRREYYPYPPEAMAGPPPACRRCSLHARLARIMDIRTQARIMAGTNEMILSLTQERLDYATWHCHNFSFPSSGSLDSMLLPLAS